MNAVLSEFKQVKELLYASEAQKLIDEGWVLINVFQRSRAYGEGVEADSVYVLAKKE